MILLISDIQRTRAPWARRAFSIPSDLLVPQRRDLYVRSWGREYHD